MIEQGDPLPPNLAGFAVDVLLGKTTKPKRQGRSRSAHVVRDAAIRNAAACWNPNTTSAPARATRRLTLLHLRRHRRGVGHQIRGGCQGREPSEITREFSFLRHRRAGRAPSPYDVSPNCRVSRYEAAAPARGVPAPRPSAPSLLNASRASLERAIAGLPVRFGSALAIEQALDRLPTSPTALAELVAAARGSTPWRPRAIRAHAPNGHHHGVEIRSREPAQAAPVEVAFRTDKNGIRRLFPVDNGIDSATHWHYRNEAG